MSKLKTSTKKKKTLSTRIVSKNSSADEEGIAKSQQLTRKLQKRKRPALVHKKTKASKICGNGIIMPSLEDLEKMYADSDESTDQDYSCDDPPHKRNRVNIKNCNSIFNAQSVEIADRLKKTDNGSDSDSTVTYEVPFNISTDCHRFSPLPSTSKDRETFLENEKRLNASSGMSPKNYSPDIEAKNTTSSGLQNEKHLSPSSEMSAKNYSPDIEANHTSSSLQNEKIFSEEGKTIIATIVLDDEGNYKACKNIQATNHDTLDNDPSSPIIIDDDDDVINDLSHSISVIEYSSVDINNMLKHDDKDCEIINIDDVIAENNAVLEKYSKSKKINNVTHVVSDTSLINVHNINSSDVRIVENDSRPVVINAYEPTINSTFPAKLSNNSHIGNIQPIIDQNVLDVADIEKPTINSVSTANIINVSDNLQPCRTSRIQRNKPANVQSLVVVDEIEQSSINSRNNGINSSQSCSIQSNNSSKGENQNIPANRQSEKRGSSILSQFVSSIFYKNDSIVETNTNKLLSEQFDKFILEYALRKSSSVADKTLQSSQQMSQPPPKRGFGDCPICMDPLADQPIVATICGHVFCKKCIEAAIKSSGKRCPTCRMSLKKQKSYHQLFL